MVSFDIFSQKFEGEASATKWLRDHWDGMFRSYITQIAAMDEWDHLQTWVYDKFPEVGKKVVEDYWIPDEEKWKRVVKEWHSKSGQVGLIVGDRGSGKTCLALKLLEDSHKRGRKVYMAGPLGLRHPKWMIRIPNFTYAPQGSDVLIDEAGSQYFARDSMSTLSRGTLKSLDQLRHTGRNVLFCARQARSTDIVIRTGCDFVVIKRQGLMASSEEKGPVRALLPLVKPHDVKSAFFLYDSWFTFIKEIRKPDCWKESFSTPYTAITKEKDALTMAREILENQPYLNLVEVKDALGLRSYIRPLSWWKSKLEEMFGEPPVGEVAKEVPGGQRDKGEEHGTIVGRRW